MSKLRGRVSSQADLNMNLGSSACELCDPGWVTSPIWGPISSSGVPWRLLMSTSKSDVELSSSVYLRMLTLKFPKAIWEKETGAWDRKRASVFWFFWPSATACGTLVPRPGIEPAPPALEAWSLKHWTARDVPAAQYRVAHSQCSVSGGSSYYQEVRAVHYTESEMSQRAMLSSQVHTPSLKNPTAISEIPNIIMTIAANKLMIIKKSRL